MRNNDEEERFNELEEEQHAAAEETDAELAATESEAPAMAGAPVTAGHPESDTADGPYVSEAGAVMGRALLRPGVHPREHAPYRSHTGRRRDHGGEDAIEIK